MKELKHVIFNYYGIQWIINFRLFSSFSLGGSGFPFYENKYKLKWIHYSFQIILRFHNAVVNKIFGEFSKMLLNSQRISTVLDRTNTLNELIVLQSVGQISN